MKHLEIKTIEHKGIKIKIEIDYDAGTIALVDELYPINNNAKKWVFAGRTIEYMESWQNILDAMKFAIKTAETELRAEQKIIEEKKVRLLHKVMKEVK